MKPKARSSEQLIKQYDKSNKWFVTFLCFLLVILCFLNIATFIMQYNSRERAAVDRGNIEQLAKDNKLLSEQIKELSEQNKKLAEDNIYLSDRKIYYLKCLGKMFVQWTQTQPPLKLNSLTKCDFTINRQAYQENFQPTGNTERSGTTATEPDRKSSATNKPRPTPPTGIPPEQRPTFVERCTIDIGIVRAMCRQERIK
jgi:cell division protein FtsB